MKLLLALVVGSLLGAPTGPIKLTLKINGDPAGGVQASQRITEDGGRMVELRLTIRNQKKIVNVHTMSTFDSKGMPIRKLQETSTSDHDMRTVIATFDADGANVVINDGSARKTKHVSVETAAPRAEVSGFWWIRDTPKIGDKTRQYAFNMDTLGWELSETTYLADTTVTVAGNKVPAHQVKTVTGDRETTVYLDEHGDPLRIESGTALMERKE